jgi:hypothetical protein
MTYAIPLRPNERPIVPLTTDRLLMAVGGGVCLAAVAAIQFFALERRLRVGLSIGGSLVGLGLVYGARRTPSGLGYDVGARTLQHDAEHERLVAAQPAGFPRLLERKNYINGYSGQEAHMTMAALAWIMRDQQAVTVCESLPAFTRSLAQQRPAGRYAFIVPTYDGNGRLAGFDQHKVAVLLEVMADGRQQVMMIDSCGLRPESSEKGIRLRNAVIAAGLPEGTIYHWSGRRVQSAWTGCDLFAVTYAETWVSGHEVHVRLIEQGRAGTAVDPFQIDSLFYIPIEQTAAGTTHEGENCHLKQILVDGKPKWRNKLLEFRLLSAQRNLIADLRARPAEMRELIRARLAR